jgi:ATPase subunit of ABC transporter with duplicated ATPase domains
LTRGPAYGLPHLWVAAGRLYARSRWARVAIAAMVASRAELLLRDEPTNHLDFPSPEVLEAALRDYPGAIVAVSHDRAFLDAIGTERRLTVRDGAVIET